MLKFHIGVDVGGTFTDLILHDSISGEKRVAKVLTTTVNPEVAILDALKDLCPENEQVALINHATTLATNALLTRSGIAKTALITNNGFRDILEIGRQQRPEVYNLYTRRPKPLVERKHRFTVHGRIGGNGEEIQPFDLSEAEQIAEEILGEDFGSVGICFLHSYKNVVHEKTMKNILLKANFGGSISCSNEVNREYKEYERTSTTVVNAVLAPLMATYLENLRKKLEISGFTAPVFMMNSDGGMNTIKYASDFPISVIESGPAAGVLASQCLAKKLSLEKVLTFDMGGTTAKAGAVINGECDISYEFEAAGKTYSGRSIKGSGYSVRYPFIDLAEVSAGGGTIAWVDEAVALHVGPSSAGSDPGPAAYGRGGSKPTITDANVVLGRLNPRYLLGGKMPIFSDLAEKAVKSIAEQLGMGLREAAEGIVRLVNLNMSKAIMTVSVERGRDPREYVMMAFGGAGPIHCCDLAEELEIKQVLIPNNAGIFSAFGLLAADITRSFSVSVLSTNLDVEPYFEEARRVASENLAKEGFNKYVFKEFVDVRYKGQSFDLRIPYRKSADLRRQFSKKHKEAYGYSSEDEIEIVNVRVKAVVPAPGLKGKKVKEINFKRVGAQSKFREAWIGGKYDQVPVYAGDDLVPGVFGRGPCIIEDYDSTLIVNPGWSWKVYDYGRMLIK